MKKLGLLMLAVMLTVTFMASAVADVTDALEEKIASALTAGRKVSAGVSVSAELYDDLKSELGDAASVVDDLLEALSALRLCVSAASAGGNDYTAFEASLYDTGITWEALTNEEQTAIVTSLLPGRTIVLPADSEPNGMDFEDAKAAAAELIPVMKACSSLITVREGKFAAAELNAEVDAITVEVTAEQLDQIAEKLTAVRSDHALVKAVTHGASWLKDVDAGLTLVMGMDDRGLPVYVKAEAKREDNSALLTAYVKEESDGRTLVKLSGVGFDFSRLNVSMRCRADENVMNLELDFSLMESNGEFDLLWFDVTASEQDGAATCEGMLQTTTTETEMTFEYNGSIVESVDGQGNPTENAEMEILVSQDSDELFTVLVSADRTVFAADDDMLARTEVSAEIEGAARAAVIHTITAVDEDFTTLKMPESTAGSDLDVLLPELADGVRNAVSSLIAQLPEDVRSMLPENGRQ